MTIWKPGLITEYKKSGGHEFILAEKPWWCESTEAIRTRYFVCDMLELLYARVRGERLVDKSTLYTEETELRRNYMHNYVYCIHCL